MRTAGIAGLHYHLHACHLGPGSPFQGLSIALATTYALVARRLGSKLGLALTMVPERAAPDDPPPGEKAIMQRMAGCTRPPGLCSLSAAACLLQAWG